MIGGEAATGRAPGRLRRPGARSQTGAQAPCDRVSIRYNHHLAELQSPLIYNRLWQTEQNFAGFRFVDFRVFFAFRSTRFSYGSSDLEGAQTTTNTSLRRRPFREELQTPPRISPPKNPTPLQCLGQTSPSAVETGPPPLRISIISLKRGILKKFRLRAANDFRRSPDLNRRFRFRNII